MPTTTDIRIAQAMLDEVASFFDSGAGAAIAQLIADWTGFDLETEIANARRSMTDTQPGEGCVGADAQETGAPVGSQQGDDAG